MGLPGREVGALLTLAVCAQDWPDFFTSNVLSLAIGAGLCYATLHLFGCLR